MTIISTLISRNYTAHASDSLITKTSAGGIREPVEWKKSKIIKVPTWRGIMSFWGLAWYEYQGGEVFMYDWLTHQANLAHQFKSAEAFAYKLAEDLNKKLSTLVFPKPLDYGIGIHFTVYEYIENYWIPEFFLISNWVDVKYDAIRSSGVGVSRETYYADPDRDPNERIDTPEFRLKVHSYLQRGGILFYNNGDPIMFNSIANGISMAVNQLSIRKILNSMEGVNSHISLAQKPIEVVSGIQRDFCREGTRLVGGKTHNLAIEQNSGIYHSTSGD